MSQSKRLLAAFVGAKNAHGTTVVGRTNRNGKAESQSRIIREPLTEELSSTLTGSMVLVLFLLMKITCASGARWM
jgi:hypothetical protein